MNAPSNQNSTVEDYTPVYVTATMHHLKMVMVKTLNHPQPLPHIRSLWLSKELWSQIFHIPCEVDTGTSSNNLPLDKANALLEQIPSWDNRQWIWKATMTAQLRILDPVLCTFIMARLKTYKVSCETADSKGHMILGRQQALLMAYIC